jgi:ubiquinone/menaquinone biosynthesis C-methylase UbiE
VADARASAKELWNTTPCGTGEAVASIEYGSREFFDEVRRRRYEVTDSWITEEIDFTAAGGKKLLEIGHGIGSDLLTFAENGAEAFGVDITAEHHNLAMRNFELHGLKADLRLCDATALCFPDNEFDIVYSLGVMHHIPEIGKCIAEAYRVLKPGGLFILILYHKFSAYHLFAKILDDGIRKGKLFTLGYSGLMATVETGADGRKIKPLVRTYSRAGVRHMLKAFSSVRTKVAHFKREHIPLFGPRLIPQSMEKSLGRRWGWYVIASATK